MGLFLFLQPKGLRQLVRHDFRKHAELCDIRTLSLFNRNSSGQMCIRDRLTIKTSAAPAILSRSRASCISASVAASIFVTMPITSLAKEPA